MFSGLALGVLLLHIDPSFFNSARIRIPLVARIIVSTLLVISTIVALAGDFVSISSVQQPSPGAVPGHALIYRLIRPIVDHATPQYGAPFESFFLSAAA